MASEEAIPVELYVYDLTHGLASVLSPAILGHQIEAVWHTAIVVYGREYFYGGSGITSCAPGSTQLGAPLQVERLGETYIPFQVFLDYVQGLATTTYSGEQYQLLSHNCNNFSDEVAQFLCGARVPKHILTLPERALPGPLRAALASLLESRLPSAGQPVFANGVRHTREDSPEYVTLNDQITAARLKSAELSQSRTSLAEKLARKERRRQKKKLRQRGAAPDDADEMAETAAEGSVPVAVAGPSVQVDEPERKHLEQPVVYRDIDAAREFEALVSALSTVELSTAEQQSVEELRQYMVLGEGCWALGDDFMPTVGRLLTDSATVPVEARTCVLRCLAACALRDDVTLLLHQDRRTHTLTNYAHGMDRLETSEQQALALFMCNLFECVSSSEWLLYISEWEHNGQPLSNIRVTTKVAVHSLLSEDAVLKDIGSALMHNIAVKEVKTVRCGSGRALRGLLPKHAKSKVFDDVCVELALALLQFLAAAPAPDEEPLYRSVRALARLAAHSADVPQLLAMLQLDPNTFRGTSQRVDEQIDKLMTKVK